MKFLKKNKILTVSIILCLMFALLAGLFSIFNNKNTMAFADTGNDDLKFVLNSSGDGYIVSKENKNLVEAIIPEEYEGLPVTEVATSGFSSCANLEYVWIPNTVTKIGANAFTSCQKLHTIKGMAFVTEIGNNAFAMCSQIEDLIIPPRVEKLGSNIIRNVSNDVYARSSEDKLISLNSNWKANSTATIIYGNDLICSEIIEDGELVGFKVEDSQDLFTTEDLELICSYEYNDKFYPILEIEDSAFFFCEFNSLTLKYDKENVGSDYIINVNSNAFYGVTAEYIDIEVDVNIDDTESVFAYSTILSVTLPYSLNKITPYMFSYCENLSVIKTANLNANYLSNNVTFIGEYAFEECTSLANLYIPGSVTSVGAYAFANWGATDTTQTIHFYEIYGPEDSWDSDWRSDLSSNVRIEYKKALVMFAKDGGNGGTDYVEATFGQAMPEATKPEKPNCTFLGYFSEMNGGGTQYYDADMNSVTDWDKQVPSIVYALWKFELEIPVNLDSCGGYGGSVLVNVTYNEDMPSGVEAPQRVGYTFQGYFEYPDGYGTMYYKDTMEPAHEWDKDVDSATIYAYWIANTYTVILSDDTTIEATYGEPMPAVDAGVPELRGYTFKGYFYEDEDGQVTQYYSAEMYSANNWDIAEDNIRLIPKYDANVYSVTILTYDFEYITMIDVTYGQPMPEVYIPTYFTRRSGYTFIGIGYDENNLYYSSDLTSVCNWDNAYSTNVLTCWEANTYTVTVDKQGGTGGPDTITATTGEYLSRIERPTKTGYYCIGYFTEPDGEGVCVYKGSFDLEYFDGQKWNVGDADTIYACWEPNIYHINFDYVTGGNIIRIPVRYGELLPAGLEPPTRYGYTFVGFYYEVQGKLIMYYDAEMNPLRKWTYDSDATLESAWEPVRSTVFLDDMGGIGGTTYVSAIYDSNMPSYATAPVREGYIFRGYYSGVNGTGDKYYDENMVSSRKWDYVAPAVVLYAYWVPETNVHVLEDISSANNTLTFANTDLIIEFCEDEDIA